MIGTLLFFSCRLGNGWSGQWYCMLLNVLSGFIAHSRRLKSWRWDWYWSIAIVIIKYNACLVIKTKNCSGLGKITFTVAYPAGLSSFCGFFLFCPNNGCSCLVLHLTLALFSGLIFISTQWCIFMVTFFRVERIKNTIFTDMRCRFFIYLQVSVISYRSLTIHPKLSKFKWKKLASITKLGRYVSLFALLLFLYFLFSG